MQLMTIQHGDQPCNEPCGVCGEALLQAAGPGLFTAETNQPVCRSCGRAEAPHLVALLDLARAADRVGKVCRHILVPPMGALLDLARAAEDYSTSRPKSLQHAA